MSPRTGRPKVDVPKDIRKVLEEINEENLCCNMIYKEILLKNIHRIGRLKEKLKSVPLTLCVAANVKGKDSRKLLEDIFGNIKKMFFEIKV